MGGIFPKCGAVLTGGETECPSCGVIPAKARVTSRPGATPQPSAPARVEPPVATGEPTELSAPFKLCRGETDYDVPNLETLREWARAGRVAPND